MIDALDGFELGGIQSLIPFHRAAARDRAVARGRDLPRPARRPRLAQGDGDRLRSRRGAKDRGSTSRGPTRRCADVLCVESTQSCGVPRGRVRSAGKTHGLAPAARVPAAGSRRAPGDCVESTQSRGVRSRHGLPGPRGSPLWTCRSPWGGAWRDARRPDRQRCVKLGGRFSTNAATPSRTSSVRKSSRNAARSRSSACRLIGGEHPLDRRHRARRERCEPRGELDATPRAPRPAPTRG